MVDNIEVDNPFIQRTVNLSQVPSQYADIFPRDTRPRVSKGPAQTVWCLSCYNVAALCCWSALPPAPRSMTTRCETASSEMAAQAPEAIPIDFMATLAQHATMQFILQGMMNCIHHSQCGQTNRMIESSPAPIVC
eukprot:6469906-Amphidinium_carterae.4